MFKAGKPSGDPTQTVSACMKSYRLKAQVDALKHDAEIFEEHREPFLYKFPHLKNTRHSGIYTEVLYNPKFNVLLLN